MLSLATLSKVIQDMLTKSGYPQNNVNYRMTAVVLH